MSDLVAGEVAVVIGADEPAARDLIDRLVSASSRVALVGRDRAVLEEQAARFQGRGSEAFALTVECTDAAAVERLRTHVEQRLGPIDLLVLVGLPRESRTVVTAAFEPDMT